jgi:hypothetical protein
MLCLSRVGLAFADQYSIFRTYALGRRDAGKALITSTSSLINSFGLRKSCFPDCGTNAKYLKIKFISPITHHQLPTTMTNINDLFQSALDDGSISNESLQALTVYDLGAQIQAGLGIHVDDVMSSEVVLVTIMPDDSGSIQYAGNAQAVRGGHNSVIDALISSQQQDNILIHNRYLNGTILYPYCPIAQAIRMDTKNYHPNQGTPLYDQTVILLGTVLAKAQEFSDNGVPVRTVTLIITDGDDCHSTRHSAKDVAAIAKDMLRMENHIIAAMGIDDGSTNFGQVFKEMGIHDEWILTTANSDGEIRKAFQVFSQSAMRASQSTTNFNSLGGFGG